MAALRVHSEMLNLGFSREPPIGMSNFKPTAVRIRTSLSDVSVQMTHGGGTVRSQKRAS